ncbi:cysteine peptidase family C39 domain-containing protein [Patescibacteria group bacterium]|nr:cysteine peptidase family C39 domain-containing protein [Patescibacteria group bacterium]
MLKLKPFEQTSGLCGPASLKIVLEYYGVRKSEAALAKLSGASRGSGVEASGLVRAAEKLGFAAIVKDRATVDDIRRHLKRGIPVIVDWFSKDDGHYSVVAGIENGRIHIQDPEIGRLRSLDLETFQRVWFDFPGDVLRSPKDVICQRMIVIRPRK